MNQENIIRMAQEAGGYAANFNGRWVFYANNIERFAELVVAHEREQCAQVCDARVVGDHNREDAEAAKCAAAIRARGEK